MEGKIADLLSFCSKVDFGVISLCQEEETFRGYLNREMLSFCSSLPISVQTDAALFLVNYLRTSLGEGLNFVDYFYAPAWSVLFWLHCYCLDGTKLEKKLVKDAVTGHTMAMFLHAFDDHLADGQLVTTHLALLMRSQAWMIMSRAFARLARGVKEGPAIVRGCVDDYYSSIGTSAGTESLDNYCALFRKQMATWLIAPVLMAERIDPEGELGRSVQAAYSSFGIAWRLLDDVQDIEKDLAEGTHSSIYASLPDGIRKEWDRVKEERADEGDGCSGPVLSYVMANRVIDKIRQRICSELESAASRADSCGMNGYADELRCLLRPLKNGESYPCRETQ